MKQESIFMFVYKFYVRIGISPLFHFVKDICGDGNLRNKNLSALTHHEHWEIIIFGILLLNIFQDG